MAPALSKSANQFAVDLFQCYLRRHGDKYRNLLLCPYVIYHSLAMMLVGAKGQTAEQLQRLLRVAPTQPPPPTSPRQQQPRSPSSQSHSSASSIGSELASSNSSLADPQPARSPNRKNQQQQKSTKSSSNSIRSRASGQIVQALYKDADEARHREFLLLSEQLLHGNHEFVHLASFIYLDKGTKRTERYKSILRDYYETKPKKIDFDNVELMVKTINEDVARTTENIYSDLLSRQEAQKLEKTFMLLVSAVFFRGFWLSNFTDVKRAPFARFDPVKQERLVFQVDMMSKLDYLPVLEDEQLQAKLIRMPFEASDLQMLLILPNERQSDSTYLCQRISAPKLQQLLRQFARSKQRTVRITMPIFCIDSGKISIQSTLVEMGAADLFDRQRANMSGVCDNKQVWLHKILHRCFIICDNRGSITSSNAEKARRREQQRLESGLSSGRSGVLEFVADHPFMYLIFDSLTQTILLMGLYTDPSETLELVHENQLSPEEAHQIYTEGVYKT